MSAVHPTDPGLSPFEVMVGYEFIPHKKLCAVPPDATAFRARGHYPNVVLMLSWDQDANSPGALQHARSCAKELSRIIEGTEETQPHQSKPYGYSNYSTSRAVSCFMLRSRVDGAFAPSKRRIAHVGQGRSALGC